MKEQNGVALMKRAAAITAVGIVAGLTLLFVSGAWSTKTASADNGPHKMGDGTAAATDRCAGCHRAHTAKGKDFLFVAGADSLEAFCETCHAGSGAVTNVRDGVFGSTGHGLRAGGIENSVIESTIISTCISGGTGCSGSQTGTVDPQDKFIGIGSSKPVKSGHAMGLGSLATVWGAGPLGSAPVTQQKTLECTSCHDPHGNGNYRILRPLPAHDGLGSQTGSAYVSDRISTGVNVADAGCPAGIPQTYNSQSAAKWPYTAASGSCTNIAKVGISAGSGNVATYETTNYYQVDYVEPTQCVDSPNSATTTGHYDPNAKLCSRNGVVVSTGLGAWCAQCHMRYLDPSSSRSYDSGDTNYKYRHSSGTTISTTSGSTRQCISCHLAHGSPSTSNDSQSGYTGDLRYPDGSAPAANGENNRSLKIDNRGICLKCHGSATFR